MRFRVVLIKRPAWSIQASEGLGYTPSTWRWRLMSAGNNKILAHSEGYITKHDAVRTAEALADALGVILETDTD